jgi:serine/threonine protein phosphatase PrpC
VTHTIRVTAMTHRGAVRGNNEDALVVGAFVASEVDLADPVTFRFSPTQPVVAAVADGLGGYGGGERASACAVRRLAAAGPDIAGPDRLAAVLDDINRAIEKLATEPGLTGMGTTVAGLVVGPDVGLWFNVGDSRVYQENGGYLGQLSRDDSPVAAFEGLADGPAPTTNLITQYLGGPGSDGNVHPHVGVVEPGGRWLICSDGLSDLVEVAEMERILRAETDEVRAVKAFWVAAMNASGRDNISVLLVSADGPASAPSTDDLVGESPTR